MLKGRLLLAISALALSAAAPQLSAAQGPTEEAAPVAERPPSAERTPTRQRATRPVRRAPQQTSFTGAQAGGFGGGNVMGGGFVEPGASQCFRDLGPALNPIIIGCAETPFNFDTRRTTGTFGAFYGYMFQYGAIVYGLEVDVAYKNAHSGFSQPVAAVINSSVACPGCFSTRTEYFNGTVTQGWDSSLRARFGYIVTPTTMVYLTAGVAIERVSGTFTYNATTINTLVTPLCDDCGPPPSGIYVDTTAGSGSWSQLVVGLTAGTGFEISLGGPLKVRGEYRYTGFGNLTENIALMRTCTAITMACPSPNFGSTIAQINLRDLNFQTVRIGLVVGL